MNTFASHSDEYLVTLLRQSNEMAFNAIYERHWENLYRLSCRKLADKELAKEIIHDVFLDLWKRRENLDIRNLQAYLSKATHYKVLDALDSKKDNFFFTLIENTQLLSAHNADADLLKKDLTLLIEKWIEALPEKRRQIFIRYYFEQLTVEEIANDLSIAPKTVHNQLSISFQYLRSRFAHLLSIVVIVNEIFPGQKNF